MAAEPMRDGVTAVHGLVAGVLNVLAIVFLQAQPHAYKANALGSWLDELRADPTGTQLGAWSFTIGLVALAVFAVGLARSPGASTLTVAGATWIGVGSILNAAGTMLPLAAMSPDAPSPLFSLAFTILLDAAFNACFALGLVLLAFGRDASLTRGQRIAAGVVGLLVAPVAMQFTSPAAAQWLMVAGPAWLFWVSWVAVSRLRRVALA